jgi:DNA-binding NarL/FixJ family response regulator
VLLEINLPDADGLSLAARLCTDGGSRVLLTSTDPGVATPRLVRESGVAGFVPKSDLAVTALDRYLKGQQRLKAVVPPHSG